MSKGRYGVHGGQYIPETLMNEIIRLEESYEYYTIANEILLCIFIPLFLNCDLSVHKISGNIL